MRRSVRARMQAKRKNHCLRYTGAIRIVKGCKQKLRCQEDAACQLMQLGLRNALAYSMRVCSARCSQRNSVRMRSATGLCRRGRIHDPTAALAVQAITLIWRLERFVVNRKTGVKKATHGVALGRGARGCQPRLGASLRRSSSRSMPRRWAMSCTWSSPMVPTLK